MEYYDDIVIGGGIYGVYTALSIKRKYSKRKVAIIEAGKDVLCRASGNNHGRLHSGYQYPLHQETVKEIAKNSARFNEDFKDAISTKGTSLYGIHKDSRVSSENYLEFCSKTGLKVKEVRIDSVIFGPDIVKVFEINEFTFSSSKLKHLLKSELANFDIKILLNQHVNTIAQSRSDLEVNLQGGQKLMAERVYNCAYSAINDLNNASGLKLLPVTHDLYNLIAIRLPLAYKDISAGVFYGPYASFVANNEVQNSTHVLAHANYSISHRSNDATPSIIQLKDKIAPRELFDKIIRESKQILPILTHSQYCGSICEIKSVVSLDPSIGDRKVHIYKDYSGLKNYTVIFGGKMNAIYDVEKAV